MIILSQLFTDQSKNSTRKDYRTMLFRTGACGITELNNVVLLKLERLSTTLLHLPKEYCLMLSTTKNNIGSAALFNPDQSKSCTKKDFRAMLHCCLEQEPAE